MRSHAEAMRDDPEGRGAAESRELDNHRNNETSKLINRSATTGSDAKRKRLSAANVGLQAQTLGRPQGKALRI